MHKLIENYNLDLKKYEDFRNKIEGLIKELLIQKSINFHKIESRVKSESKVEEKILRKNDKYHSIDEMTDIIGLRIITYFEDEVDIVAKIIENEFEKDTVNTIDKRNLESDRFGYKSLHYVVSIDEKRKQLSEYHRFKELKFEIQIRSILQHAWAEIEHDLGYKGELSIPNNVKRNFYRVAALLETADIEFVKIKEQLKIYEENVDKEIKTNPGEVEINIASLKSFILSSPTVIEIDKKVASEVKRTVDTHNNTPMAEMTIERLYLLNIKTIEQLNINLSAKKDLIPFFAKKWMAASGMPVKRGISIFYLCYVLVGEKNDLKYAEKFFAEAVDKSTILDSAIKGAERIIKTYNEITSV